jgi:hypothetical protein
MTADVTDALARQSAIQGLRGGADPLLGFLHETLARDCGAAGPERLTETRRHLAQAQAAFGSGEVPEYLGKWRRQFRWLAMALSDAGEFEDAEGAVLRALGAASWEEAAQVSGAAHRRLAARILAELPEECAAKPGPRAAVDAALSRLRSGDVPAQPHEHLWLYHAGALAKQRRETHLAREAWSRSAELAAALPTPSRRAAALLPLAALAHWAALEPAQEALALEVLGEHSMIPSLRETPLGKLSVGSDPQSALARISDSPARFFPFARR